MNVMTTKQVLSYEQFYTFYGINLVFKSHTRQNQKRKTTT